MSARTAPISQKLVEIAVLDELFAALRAQGFALYGPVVRHGAVTVAPITVPAELPIGWTETQERGSYRLVRRADEARFGFTVGAGGWKSVLYPSTQVLFSVDTRDGDFRVETPPAPRPAALIGVRACELAAIAIHDRVFTGGTFADTAYAERRRNAFVVAVQCTESAPTCFCASMGTGPAVAGAFDLRLTERVEGARHELLCEAGSVRGAALLEALPGREADDEAIAWAQRAVEHAASRQRRGIEREGLSETLTEQPEHPRWQDVAARCLACGNCTMVCPTCFCSTVRDSGDLAGYRSSRTRQWDSCFTADFSYVHGGPVRRSTSSRYRQWLTHKLATWQAQFGTLGCVGCGRCITWCPTGIDLTEEVAALRQAPPHQAVGEHP